MVKFLNIKNSKSGMVFVTVLVIIIIMMIVTVSIMSMNVSQVMVSEGEIKRIQAEMLAQGVLNTFYADQALTSPQNMVLLEDNVGSRGFSANATMEPTKTGINDTHNVTISVSF